MNPAFVKILFRFISGVLEHDSMETLWAAPVDVAKGLYRIDSIPFYTPMLAFGDVVMAEYDAQESMLTWRKTVQASGNSTIQVMMTDPAKTEQSIRDIFREMGCKCEGNNTGYFVMTVPEDLDYIPIKLKLELLSGNSVLDYAEPCLSSSHQYS